MHVPPNHSSYKITCDKKRDGWDYAKLLAEFVGLGFLIAYTLYTAGIYCANKKAADAAKIAADAAKTSADTAVQTMHIDERAWINILAGKSVMADNAPLVMPIAIVNQGRTPALNVSGKMFVNLLPVNEEPDFIYKKGHPAYQLSLKTLLPNRPSEEASFAALPKYDQPDTPVKPIIVGPKLRGEIAAGHLYIVVHLRLEYDDIFGIHHWLQFCAHAENATPGVKAKSAGSACGDYNDVDRNI